MVLGLQPAHIVADIYDMSIPPPGWSSIPIDELDARRQARLESSRVRRFMAKAFRVLLIVLVITIVIGLVLAAVASYMLARINGPE